MRQIDESEDQSLRVLGNDDCPLRITEAKSKELTGPLFTKLTGMVTDLEAISSVPEVTLVNASQQTVTTFYLAIRDPKSRKTRGFIKSNLALKPGESYVVKREHFAGAEKMTVLENGEIRETVVDPGLKSEKRWIEFAGRSDIFITIAKVEFENGESWVIKEGGEVR